MSIGSSGRIVIEIDTELKQQLYAILEQEHLTLKEWFLRNANSYIKKRVQPSLFDSQTLQQSEVAA